MIGGIIWILLLPLDQYSRQTYISENALLPGQVHTYFHGTDQNIFRAYYHEVADVLEVQAKTAEDGTQQYMQATPHHRNEKIRSIFHNSGIKTAVQPYKYSIGGKQVEGENVYGIVHAPRGDGTESIVIIAPIHNFEGQLNTNGVTLLLTLARYFSRWSLWSKDIILLVTPDTAAGPQAWIDAYLSQHDPNTVSSLTLKSGAIQGVIVIDYPFRHLFHELHVTYDGVNGQLPNLDLINTAISISSSQCGIPTLLQNQHTYAKAEHQHHYLNRLKVLGHGMRNQAIGHSTGAHSVFMPYHIDAITLTAVGSGREDEMAFGRAVESLTRSINNLLEKFHQSFFFYLLLQNTRFVSIGTYLPSAMAVGAGFSVMAIYLWMKSAYEQRDEEDEQVTKATEHDSGTMDKTEKALANPNISNGQLLHSPADGGTQLAKKKVWKFIDRPIALPIAFLTILYLTSLIPVIILVIADQKSLLTRVGALSAVVIMLPPGLSFALMDNLSILNFNLFSDSTTISDQANGVPKEKRLVYTDTSHLSSPATRLLQFHTVLKSLSLLVLGLQLTVLATLNFSLSMFLGVLCLPLAFVGYYPLAPLCARLSLIAIVLCNPFVVTNLAIMIAKLTGMYGDETGMKEVLRQWLETVQFAWVVWGSWGPLAGVFCVWLPAWVVASFGVVSSFLYEEGIGEQVTVKTPRYRDASGAKEVKGPSPPQSKNQLRKRKQ